MEFAAGSDSFGPPVEQGEPEAPATSELQTEHQGQQQFGFEYNSNGINSGHTSTIQPEKPSAIPLLSSALTADPTRIHPLSSAAQVVARVNDSGVSQSAQDACPGIEYKATPPQPQQISLKAEMRSSDDYKVEENIPTTSHSVAGAVENHHQLDYQPPATPQSLIPSNPIFSDAESYMGAQPSKTATSNDAPEQPVAAMKNTTTATTPAITPSGAAGKKATSSAKRKAQTKPRGAGAKKVKRRKTGKNKDGDDDGVVKAGDSSSDESSEPTPTTTQTKSGRLVNRPEPFKNASEQQQQPPSSASPMNNQDTSAQPPPPPPKKRRRLYRKGKENHVTCLRCERGHSPTSNVIVFCDECNDAWHQFCHDPPIQDEVVTVKEAQWFCKDCVPEPKKDATPSKDAEEKTVSASHENDSVQPVLPSQALVGGSRFSLEQQRGYLGGLSHAALVDLLLNVSASYPEAPVFPENLSELPLSAFAHPPPGAHDVSTTPTALPGDGGAAPVIATTSSNSQAPAEPIPSNTTSSSLLAPASAATAVPPVNQRSGDKVDDGEDEFVEHRLYPRPGNGFRLQPASVDLNMLLEDPACRTFSHSLHGPARNGTQPSGLQAVGSAA